MPTAFIGTRHKSQRKLHRCNQSWTREVFGTFELCYPEDKTWKKDRLPINTFTEHTLLSSINILHSHHNTFFPPRSVFKHTCPLFYPDIFFNILLITFSSFGLLVSYLIVANIFQHYSKSLPVQKAIYKKKSILALVSCLQVPLTVKSY